MNVQKVVQNRLSKNGVEIGVQKWSKIVYARTVYTAEASTQRQHSENVAQENQ